MNYTPMTDEEIENANLIPDSTECNAEIIESMEHTSKEGKESIKLIVEVYHGEGKQKIFCYLTPAYAKLWKHAIVTMLGETVYQSGNISASMFEYKLCKVIIGVDEYKGKKKNIITDFIITKDGGQIPEKKDDLPF
jgi:hypothetical protein